LIFVADGTAWRLVSQCATVEDVVRVFRTLASADGLTGIPVSGIGPGGGSQVRLVLALSTKAAVLDGDAVVTTGPGTVSVRFTKIDARGKGLLAHMVEHRASDAPPAVPRHLVPLGAAAGTSASARGDVSMAKCTFEPMPRTRTPTGDVASTVRMPGARQPAPPTIRESSPAGLAAAAAAAEPVSERPKREMQKTLMGMPTMSKVERAAPAVPIAAATTPSSATTKPVPTGTPPGGFAESTPVPTGAGAMKETGPTQPTRGKGVASPAVAVAAQAIAATPLAFDHAPTTPSTAPRPIDDAPTIPNDDIVTDVAVALPDLPSGDYSDPLAEPPTPAPVPAVPVPMTLAQSQPSQPLPQVPAYAAGSSPGWQPPAQLPIPQAPLQHVTPGGPGYPPMHAMHGMPPAAMPVMPPQPYYPTPYPLALAPPAGIAPMMIDRDDDMTEMVQLQRIGGRRRWPVIAVTSGVIVVGIIAMVVVAASGKGGKKAALAAKTGSAAPHASPPATTHKAPAAGTATALAAKTDGTCTIHFTSSPDAADVVIGGKVVGATPYDHTGPCGALDVTFQRDKYQSITKNVAAGETTVDVRLERPQFKVKVLSRPPGAMVKVGGAEMGKTPVTISVPAYETTTLELVKSGKTTTQRIYPDKNNDKVDVKLRR
jgi:hypothetical protein